MIFRFAEICLQSSGAGGHRCWLKQRYINIDSILEVEQRDSQTSYLKLSNETRIEVFHTVDTIVSAVNLKNCGYVEEMFDADVWKEYVKEKGWIE